MKEKNPVTDYQIKVLLEYEKSNIQMFISHDTIC